jgi:hypothetical protein
MIFSRGVASRFDEAMVRRQDRLCNTSAQTPCAAGYQPNFRRPPFCPCIDAKQPPRHSSWRS